METIRELARLAHLAFEQEVSRLWEPCRECLFRSLYLLPSARQTHSALALVNDYIERHHVQDSCFDIAREYISLIRSGVNSPSTFHAILPRLNTTVIDFPNNQSAIEMSIIELISACRAFAIGSDNTTSHSVNCVALAITQNMSNVWTADDPQAVEWHHQRWSLLERSSDDDEQVDANIQQLEELLRFRTMDENIASRAIFAREWIRVADILDSEIKLCRRHVAPDQLERIVAKWKAHSMLFVDDQSNDQQSPAE